MSQSGSGNEERIGGPAFCVDLTLHVLGADTLGTKAPYALKTTFETCGTYWTFATDRRSLGKNRRKGIMAVSAPSTPKILRRGDAAKRLGIHPNTLASWVKRGWLSPVEMPGGEVRFYEAEINELRERIYAQ